MVQGSPSCILHGCTVAASPSGIRNHSRSDPLNLRLTGYEAPAPAHRGVRWLIAMGKPQWAVGVATSLRLRSWF